MSFSVREESKCMWTHGKASITWQFRISATRLGARQEEGRSGGDDGKVTLKLSEVNFLHWLYYCVMPISLERYDILPVCTQGVNNSTVVCPSQSPSEHNEQNEDCQVVHSVSWSLDYLQQKPQTFIEKGIHHSKSFHWN